MARFIAGMVWIDWQVEIIHFNVQEQDKVSSGKQSFWRGDQAGSEKSSEHEFPADCCRKKGL